MDVPVVFVDGAASGYDEIKAALLRGDDVIIREAVAGLTVEDMSKDVVDSEKSCVSYGEVPPKKRLKLEATLRRFLAKAVKDLQEFGEPSAPREQIEWHRLNERLFLRQAMLDMLVHGRAYVASGALQLPGHWSASLSYGNLYVDERTGKAIDFPGRSRKDSYLRLGNADTPAPAAAIFHVPFDEYRDLDSHRSERQRVQRQLSIANVVWFNSFDFLERRRRYQEWKVIKDEHRASTFEVYAQEKVMIDKMDALVPFGVRVSPSRQFRATETWR